MSIFAIHTSVPEKGCSKLLFDLLQFFVFQPLLWALSFVLDASATWPRTGTRTPPWRPSSTRLLKGQRSTSCRRWPMKSGIHPSPSKKCLTSSNRWWLFLTTIKLNCPNMYKSLYTLAHVHSCLLTNLLAILKLQIVKSFLCKKKTLQNDITLL